MGVDVRVNQLNVYPHFVSSPLHAAFEYSSYAQFASRCLQVFWLALVFGCGRTRDHLQIADASEFRQDLILNAIGEVSIVWVTAQIVEWENRDAFLQS